MIARTIRRGVTLVETLVAVGVVGILVSLLLPAVQSARGAAQRVACQNSLKQVGLALHHYEASTGRLPPGPPGRPGVATPEALLSWMAPLLPHVEEEALWRATVAACRVESNPYRDPPHVGFATPVKVFVCAADARLLEVGTEPSGRRAAFTSYLGLAGSFVGPAARVTDNGRTIVAAPGVFGERPGVRLAEVIDGTSQTVAAGERPPPASFQAGLWYADYVIQPGGGPDGVIRYGQPWDLDAGCASLGHHFGPGRLDNPCDRNHLWSLHRDGANFLFVDGSVRFLPYAADAALPALATRAGGEVVDLP